MCIYKSRHSVYYLRIVFQDGKEIRKSLGTKNARLAVILGGKVLSETNSKSTYLEQKAQIEKAVNNYKAELLRDGAFSDERVKLLQNCVDLSNPVSAEAAKRILKLNEQAKNFELSASTDFSNKSNAKLVSASYTLQAAVSDFLLMKSSDGSWSPKTVSQSTTIFKSIVDAIGCDKPVKVIRRKDAEAYKDSLLKKGSASGTINKRLILLAGLFKWLVMHERTDMNPFLSLNVKSDNASSKRREGYSDKEVFQILEVADKYKNYKKWIPWLLFYTGCRINELCQLHKADVFYKDGVWLIKITDEGAGQRLKNQASKRIVPVHSHLVEEGFINFVNSREEGLIWDGLPLARDGYMRNASKWFSSITKGLSILDSKNKNKTAHSCRHTVITKLIESGAPDRVMKAIVGHAQGDIAGDVYFKGFSVQGLQDGVERLCYVA